VVVNTPRESCKKLKTEYDIDEDEESLLEVEE